MGLLEPVVHRREMPKKKSAKSKTTTKKKSLLKRQNTDPKGLNPSRTYKTISKKKVPAKKRTGTNPSMGKKKGTMSKARLARQRSEASKKGWVTRRKNQKNQNKK